MFKRIFTVAAACAWLVGCAHGYIAGTQVRNTPDNREILAVLDKAFTAMRARDADALLALISKRYFEDNGTADQSDDYGYQELKDKVLPESMRLAKEFQIDAEVQAVEVEGNVAYADLRYTSRVQLALPSGTKWHSTKEFDRVEFVREDGAWRIISGL